MFVSYCIGFVVIAVVTQCSHGEDGEDKCNMIPKIENFDVEKLMGKWYAQELSAQEEIQRRCLVYSAVSDHKKVNATVTVNRIWDKKSEKYKIYQVNNSNQFSMEWFGKRRNGWVLDMDDSYCSWYICYPDENKFVMIISTHEERPDSATMKKARETYKTAGVNLSNITISTVDHSGCTN